MLRKINSIKRSFSKSNDENENLLLKHLFIYTIKNCSLKPCELYMKKKTKFDHS